MKIAIHCNQFDGRGSGKVLYDYGIGLTKLLNHNVIFITSSQHKNEALKKIQREFKVITYDTPPIHNQSPTEQLKTNDIIKGIIDKEKVDFAHFIKSGQYDRINPTNCKTGIHCVFLMHEPHGNVYAGISEYIARKFNSNLFVPHMITNYPPTKNLRKELNIPDDALLIGRHGGGDSFNASFVHDVIKMILEHRKDIYFLLLSTDKFYQHEKIIHLPWVETEQEKFNFIHSCDAMIHARIGGETFGIACGEFSIANKPVITWDGTGDPTYDKCHIDILGNSAILYKDGQDLLNILYSLDKKELAECNWDKYSEKYNEKSVINKYREVFLQ
jgi:hypothetical protein